MVFTATVSGPGGTPAGSVAWSGSDCSSTSDLTAGVATCSITGALASSTYTETASFTDTDDNYSDSSGSDGPVISGPGQPGDTDLDLDLGHLRHRSHAHHERGIGHRCAQLRRGQWHRLGLCDHAGQLSSSSAGTCLVTATKAADANYNVTSSAQTTVTLAKANQATLTLTSTSGIFGTALTLTTSGGSGTGALSYAVVNGTALGCAITSGQLSSSSAGTCLVTATKAADANYNVTSSTQTTVTLAKANQATLTLTSTSGIFGTALTLTTSGGRAPVRSATPWSMAPPWVVRSARVSSPRARRARCLVTATKAADANYNVTSFGPDDGHLGQGQPGHTDLDLDLGHLRHRSHAHHERGIGHRCAQLRRGQWHRLGLCGQRGSALFELGGHLPGHRHQGRRRQLQRHLVGPDDGHLGQGQPGDTDLDLDRRASSAPLSRSPRAEGSGTGALSYAVVNGTASGCAVSAGQLSSSSAGTCLVTATKAADANYNVTSSAQTTVTLVVAPTTAVTVPSTGTGAASKAPP